MLAGRRPFEAAEPVSVLAMQVTATPDPLRAHVPDVPVHIAALVDCMLAKDPAKRPTMLEGAASLETMVGGQALSRAVEHPLPAKVLSENTEGIAPGQILRKMATLIFGIPAPSPTRFPRTAADAPQAGLRSCLPKRMHAAEQVIHDFLTGLFARYEVTEERLLKLHGPRTEHHIESDEYLAIFMAEGHERPGLGTRTFANYTEPLERLTSDQTP